MLGGSGHLEVGEVLAKALIGGGFRRLSDGRNGRRDDAASLMFDAGLTLFDVQRRLGHKSPLMTAEVYTHLMRERYEEGRVRMEEYMRRADGLGG